MQSVAWLMQNGPRLPAATDSETRLVAAAQRRDRAAFDALRRPYDTPLRGFLARRLTPDCIDDVLQETWLTCWHRLPDFQGRSRFKAWLYGIALHKCQEQYRAHAQSLHESSLDGAGDIASSTRIDAAFELRETVQEMLTLLPEAQREVLELYYFAELTLPEIAATLPRNLNTVKYQFYQAHERVAQGLKRLNDSLTQFDPNLAKGSAR